MQSQSSMDASALVTILDVGLRILHKNQVPTHIAFPAPNEIQITLPRGTHFGEMYHRFIEKDHPDLGRREIVYDPKGKELSQYTFILDPANILQLQAAGWRATPGDVVFVKKSPAVAAVFQSSVPASSGPEGCCHIL